MKLYNLKQVLEMVGLSRPQIYKMVRSGTFPAPVYPNPRTPRWEESELEKWIAGMKKDRDRGLKPIRKAAA